MSKKKRMCEARELARQQSNHRLAAYEHLGELFGEPVLVNGWPEAFAELAEAILDPRVTVTNRERDMLAKGLPFGTVTNRHGESIRPQYRSEG